MKKYVMDVAWNFYYVHSTLVKLNEIVHNFLITGERSERSSYYQPYTGLLDDI